MEHALCCFARVGSHLVQESSESDTAARERYAAALNEWSRRAISDARKALCPPEEGWSAVQWQQVYEPRLELALRRINSAAKILGCVEDKPKNRALVFANRAVLYRALLAGRHLHPRRHAQAEPQAGAQAHPEVSWQEMQLYERVDEAYSTALSVLQRREPQWAIRWDNIVWERILAHLDRVEAYSCLPIESMSESEVMKRALLQRNNVY